MAVVDVFVPACLSLAPFWPGPC